MDDRWIKSKVKCCACGGSLEKSRHVNIVPLDKLATWDYPVWGNILVADTHPEKRAVAFICDNCFEGRKEVKFAVEWDKKKNLVKYHLVHKLKDLPPITEKEVSEAERRLYGFMAGGG